MNSNSVKIENEENEKIIKIEQIDPEVIFATFIKDIELFRIILNYRIT